MNITQDSNKRTRLTAERILAGRFGADAVDHHTFVIAGDGPEPELRAFIAERAPRLPFAVARLAVSFFGLASSFRLSYRAAQRGRPGGRRPRSPPPLLPAPPRSISPSPSRSSP